MNPFGKKYGITVIIVFGIILRLFAYFRGISFWGDEAALALNVLEHSYSGLSADVSCNVKNSDYR